MDEQLLQALNERLWRRAEADGLVLSYEYKNLTAFTMDLEGWYEHRELTERERARPDGYSDVRWERHRKILESPRIHIVRDRSVPARDDFGGNSPEPSQALLPDELFTLAHEYGHALSARAGHRSQLYVSAVNTRVEEWPSQLSVDQRAAIFVEEDRAWSIAWDVLEELGFTDRSAFEQRRDASLAIYRERLSWPSLRGDALATVELT